MSDKVDVEIELPDYLWEELRNMASDQNITLDELVNNILREELDRLESE